MSEMSEKCQTSSASSGGSSKSMGVQKFCSKLRHKIENNLNSARLTDKLRKSSRHSMSMSALSGIADSTTGKYSTLKSGKLVKEVLTKTKTSGMLKHKRIVTKTAEEKTPQKSEVSSPGIATHKEISSDSCLYVDSDDEYPLHSLSWTKQSLEDEIFEELEKAAHDENKLNSVLKSFDRILTDFHDETTNDKKQIENHVNCDAIEKAVERQKNDIISSYNLDKNIAPENAKNHECKNILRSGDIEIDKKLTKSRTTICENNLPKKVSTTTKLNKSVLDVTTTPSAMPLASKIPIWKALPLSKRSKSFCYAPTIETSRKPIAINPINISMGHRASSYTTLPRQKQTQKLPLKSNNSNKLLKSKTELNVRTKSQQYRNSNSWKSITTQQPQISMNLRSNTNSDELLDKCLEKGQQILKKIENLGEQGARLKAATENTVKKTTQPENNYMQRIRKDTKNMVTQEEILGIRKKDPKYLADQNSDALSDDSGHISNEADVNQTNGLCESSTSTLESLCDIETDTILLNKSITPNVTSTPRSTKIIELLQKFENTTAKTTTAMTTIKKSNAIKPTIRATTTATANNLTTQNICTSLKVSEVETVHRVQTHVEIFPNYTKEVTTWFY